MLGRLKTGKLSCGFCFGVLDWFGFGFGWFEGVFLVLFRYKSEVLILSMVPG